MECGPGRDLEDALSHENIAMALHCAVSVAKCLKYLNEDCNIIDGDVKAGTTYYLELLRDILLLILTQLW